MLKKTGVYCDSLVFVLSGCLYREYVYENGKKLILEIIGEKDYIFLDSSELDISMGEIVASKNCTVGLISLADVQLKIDNTNAIESEIIRFKDNKIRELSSLLINMSRYSLKARLASTLTNLISKYGVWVGTSCKLNLKLSQDDLASLTSGTRQNVSKIVSDWTKKGWIEKVDGKINFLDLISIKNEIST